MEDRKPPSDARFAAQPAEAVPIGGGWVYEIDGAQVEDPDGAVPAAAIKGAWQIGPDGEVIGALKSNPNYRPLSG